MAHAFGDDCPNEWNQAHANVQKRMTLLMEELDTVADLLDAIDVPVVALKNAGIARGLYACPGCNPMGDLDVMVRRSDFRKAHEALVDHGYEFEFRSELEENDLDEAELGGGTEYWKDLGDGQKLWLELQWRPVAGRWIRPDQEPNSDELMDRSVPIPGSKVRLLAPNDNLLQVALHTAKHTYVRAPGVRLHTDVDRIVNRQSIDWDAFVAEVSRAQLRTAVYFSLAIAHDILSTPIPSETLAKLKPAGWKRWILAKWIGKAGLFGPNRRKFGRIQYIFFTVLLFDDLRGVLKGIFPNRAWMKQRYGNDSRFSIVRAYLHRIYDLVFRRQNT